MNPIKTLWKGIDTLKIGVSATWSADDHDYLTRLLEKLQANARDPAADPIEIELHCDKPARGLANGRHKYKHGLQTDGLRIFFEQRHNPDNQTPNVWIEAGPTQVAVHGPASVLYQATEILHHLKATVNWHRISEIHCTTDIETDSEMHPADFYEESKPKFCTRSKFEQQWREATDSDTISKGHTLETFRRGSGQLLLRIYDKTRHILQHPTYAWESTLWNTTTPPMHVIRTEFQIRREKLKQLKINTIEDWKRAENSVWAYLTEDWFLLQETAGHRRYHGPSTFWQAVIDSRPTSNPLKPKPTFSRHISQRASQVIGNMASAIALVSTEKEINDEAQAWEEIKTIYTENHPEPLNIMQQIRDRLSKMRSIHGDAVIFGQTEKTPNSAICAIVRGDVIDHPPARPAGLAPHTAHSDGREEGSNRKSEFEGESK